MGCHPQRQACLPHAGPPRDHDEIGRLEPRRNVVEVVKSGGNARDMLFSFGQLINKIETFLNDGINGVNDRSSFP